MPEGPELHLASRLVNSVCSGRLFSGKVIKSEVSTKNPDVAWDAEYYTISAHSRGKEMKLTLQECTKNDEEKLTKTNPPKVGKVSHIIFRFGMSGKFKFDKVSDMHKHAHLKFFTSDGNMVLSYIDVRRFGKWEQESDWGKKRGPCIIFEYKDFRSNILSHLDVAAFKRPICEAMLNQQYFNGVGNYLRAEVLYRLGIPPFVEAHSVLKKLDEREDIEDGKEINRDNPDLIDMCTILAREVIELGATNYTIEDDAKDHSAFNDWLQCYYQPGMNNITDHNSRTMWFKGISGPMAPKEKSQPGRKRKGKKKVETDEEESPQKKIKVELKAEVQSGNKGRRQRVKWENEDNHDYVAPSSRRSQRSKVKVEEEAVEDMKPPKRSSRKIKKEASLSVVKPPVARTKQTKRTSKSRMKTETKDTTSKKTVSGRGSSSSSPASDQRVTRSRTTRK
ncbi:endonuclease 8-like 1 [Lineus longissimus]|uniref:endonuclease 8-like 1 n=1 Tax=Lineus longissimus TaxID=88925 RepID=UPI00315C845F